VSLRSIVVLGTGTEVGKTAVSSALLTSLSAQAPGKWAGLKPVETGYVEATSDAGRLSRAAGHRLVRPRFTSPHPVSPHLAAREAGLELAPAELVEWVEGQRRTLGAEGALIETAGGAFSPLPSKVGMWALAQQLPRARVLLVAANRLGVLHDVLCAISALRGLGVHPEAVVLNELAADHSAAGNLMELPRLCATEVFRHARDQTSAPELAAWAAQ